MKRDRTWLRRSGWRSPLAALVLLIGLGAGASALPLDPELVVGPDECAECHKKETATWQNTHHFSTFRDLPNNADAETIASKMGVRRLKAESLCLGCHFTVQTSDGEPKAIAGISCESCHGAGENWYKVHSEFSGKKEGEETDAEIAERWAKSEAAGMIRPAMTYTLATNCFGCHLVPNEELVNVGGHTPGSSFELVSWTQGEVRHNSWYNKGASNPEASIERKRMLFVVGRIAELEASLIGVSKATARADYALKMAKRADDARKVVATLAQLLPDVPELTEISQIAAGVELKLNNEAALVEAAGKISVLGLKFAADYDGTQFVALDQYIPDPSKYKGTASN